MATFVINYLIVINKIITISGVGAVLEIPKNCAVEYTALSRHLGIDIFPPTADKLTPQKCTLLQ